MYRYLILLVFFPGVLWAESLTLYKFSYNGPKDHAYVAQALEDSLIAGLKENGLQVILKDKILNPDKLQKKEQRGSLSGRINWLGASLSLKISAWNQDGQLIDELFQFKDVHSASDEIRQKSKLIVDKLQASGRSQTIVSKKIPEQLQKKSEKSIMKLPREDLPKIEKIKPFQNFLSDYRFRSQRLPFEARSMLVSDLNGDGNDEIVIASDDKIYFYHRQGNALQSIGFYKGKNLDRFVKLSLIHLDGDKKALAVTNLRGEQANSLILSFNQDHQPELIAEKIPYLIREIDYEDESILACEKYNAREALKHQLYAAHLQGDKVKIGKKLDLPNEASLFSFEWVYTHHGKELLLLSPSGNLKLYNKQDGHYKKRWSSSEKFGGSFNSVEVEVRNALGEVVKDRFTIGMPVKVFHYEKDGHHYSDVLLVKNGPFLNSALGRGFLLKSAYLLKLNWNDLGFAETWKSQKIEGGFADYQLMQKTKGLEAIGVARLRNKGFMSPTQVNESIVFIYDVKS